MPERRPQNWWTLGAVKDIQLAVETLNLSDDLLVMAGDNVLDFSLSSFVSFMREKQTSCVMCHEENELKKQQKTAIITVNSESLITSYEEKPKEPKGNLAVPPFYCYRSADVNFWDVVVAYAGVKFKTYSGLLFSYEVRKGRNGEYTKELWIDRREKSKSLAWSSVLLALGNIKEKVVDRPKALGDIRGVTYIYGMFYRFGLIDVPDEVKEKMGHPKKRKK